MVNEIKAAYETKAGKQIPKSTVYRMLSRHGWRKVFPRPKHPKADLTEQEEFKKNSPPVVKAALECAVLVMDAIKGPLAIQMGKN